jgi:hypothetical protein
MPSATAFERLAPDQRADVELVLRQGRSYGELADLLGLPEETIRARARNGLAALAPDLPAPQRAGEICDWLLGQQSEAHAARTRALLESDAAAKRWAQTVAAPLRQAPGGEAVPQVDGAGNGAVKLDKGAAGKAAAAGRAGAGGAAGNAASAGRATADGAAATGAGGEPMRRAAHDDAPSRPAPSGGRSSKLGGAIIIGASALLVAAVLVFVLTRGGDDPEPSADTAAPPATATATASPATGANDILLRGPAGSQAVGLMRLIQANDGTVRFALAAQGVAPNAEGERYSVWFRKDDGKAQLLGDVQQPVGENGELTSSGPSNADVDEFPQWFVDYDTILVTLDDKGAKEPGKVVLSGDLPSGG